MSKQSHESDPMRWALRIAGVAVPLLLIGVAILHAISPKSLSLDWQTVTLLILEVVLAYVPMQKIAGLVQSLEIGKIKILLRASDELNAATAKAEVDAVVLGEAEQPIKAKTPEPSKKKEERPELCASEMDNNRGSDKVERTESTRRQQELPTEKIQQERSGEMGEFTSEFEPFDKIVGEVRQLQVIDAKAALVRLAMSIESTVVELAKRVPHNRRTHPTLFRQALLTLTQTKTIPHSLATGLAQFMNIRNEVLHLHMRKPLEEELIQGAISNGLSLTQILLSFATQFNEDTLTGETVSLI